MNRTAVAAALLGGLFFLAVGSAGCSRPEVLFPQLVEDQMVELAILGTLQAATTQAVAGRVDGAVDAQVACPDGGTIQVTGSLTDDGAWRHRTLELQLSGCQASLTWQGAAVDLALSGLVSLDFEYEKSTGYSHESYTSDELAISGDTQYGEQQGSWNDRCRFEATYVVGPASDAVLGEVCDRPVSMSLSYKL